MKKLIGLFVAAMMLFSVMTANAKVTYEEKDGKGCRKQRKAPLRSC